MNKFLAFFGLIKITRAEMIGSEILGSYVRFIEKEYMKILGPMEPNTESYTKEWFKESFKTSMNSRFEEFDCTLPGELNNG